MSYSYESILDPVPSHIEDEVRELCCEAYLKWGDDNHDKARISVEEWAKHSKYPTGIIAGLGIKIINEIETGRE